MSTARQTGERIAHWMAIREKSRLQVRLIQEILKLSSIDGFVLGGAVALHRVYLNKRWSEDLDFFAPKALSGQIIERLADRGHELRHRPQLIPAYEQPGICFDTVGIGVDVSPQDDVRSELRIFRGLAGEELRLNVCPLHDIIADKLDCVMGRARATDFADLWWSLEVCLSSVEEIRALQQKRRRRDRFEAGIALRRLDEISGAWHDDLARFTMSVPDVLQVKADLIRILPLFEGDPTCH